MYSTVDAVKARLTAEQVARHYGLRPDRAGFVRCPFHQGDRTASLKLYPGKKGWHCFGCHKGGSVIDLVMELFGISFSQAVVRLDADFHLGLTGERPNPAQRAATLAGRLAERREEERRRREYFEAACEHRYWYEIQRWFAPTRDEWEVGWIHPFYLEALRRLPALEHYLDENLMR